MTAASRANCDLRYLLPITRFRLPGRQVLMAVIAAMTLQGALLATIGPSAADDSVRIEHLEDHPYGTDTVRMESDLAPALKACLFESKQVDPHELSTRSFALQCVVPYIHGLWLDPDVLYRSNADIVAQARDQLILRATGQPFPIFYPPELEALVRRELDETIKHAKDIVLKPLPFSLPKPSLDPSSLYNNIGLLYLPNPYVVPGEKFNEMYGWDSFFIIKGILATVDYIMRNPTAQIWSPRDQTFFRLSAKPEGANYYRAYAERLFDTAKGMVDNHIFQIEYYGGFVLNANRAYYLTRSQPPLFTQEAIAVLETANKYGFAYDETLAPYLRLTRPNFVEPNNFDDWVKTEVLPAARKYYAYWTDPQLVKLGSHKNPRVIDVDDGGSTQPVYLFGTDGLGPPPEVARSTQPQNRELYRRAARYFDDNPAANPNRKFYNPEQVCETDQPADNCGDPTYGLTQSYYAADRAIRASGFDLSGRFGKAGEWAMHYAPISLNMLLLRMAEDIDALSIKVGEPAPNGNKAIQARKRFLARFFARGAGSGGYADRFVVGDKPAIIGRLAYAYATQFYLLWADVLARPKETEALVDELKVVSEEKTFLAPVTAPHFGIPSSLRDTGKQWDAPFAWAPIQYFAVDGLVANDFMSEATVAMEQWIAAVNTFFADTGVLIEKYDSENPDNDPRARIGYAKAQRGFGWTNGVYMLFVNRLYQRF